MSLANHYSDDQAHELEIANYLSELSQKLKDLEPMSDTCYKLLNTREEKVAYAYKNEDPAEFIQNFCFIDTDIDESHKEKAFEYVLNTNNYIYTLLNKGMLDVPDL